MDGGKKRCCNHDSCPHKIRLDEQTQHMLAAQSSSYNTGGKNSAQILFVEPNFTETPSEYEVFYDCISSDSGTCRKLKGSPKSSHTHNGAAKSNKIVPKEITNMEDPLEFRDKLQHVISTAHKLLKSFDDAAQLDPQSRKCKCKRPLANVRGVTQSPDVELSAQVGGDGNSVVSGQPKEIHFDQYTLRIEPISFKIPLKVNIQSGRGPPHATKLQKINELTSKAELEPIRTATIAATKPESRGPFALPSAAEVLLSELVPPAKCTQELVPGEIMQQVSAKKENWCPKHGSELSVPSQFSAKATSASDMKCAVVGGQIQKCINCVCKPAAKTEDSRKNIETDGPSGMPQVSLKKENWCPKHGSELSVPSQFSAKATSALDMKCVLVGGQIQKCINCVCKPAAKTEDSRKKIETPGPSGMPQVSVQMKQNKGCPIHASQFSAKATSASDMKCALVGGQLQDAKCTKCVDIPSATTATGLTAEVANVSETEVGTQTSYTAFRKTPDSCSCTKCTPGKHCERCKGGEISILYLKEPKTSSQSFIAFKKIAQPNLLSPAILSTSFTELPPFPVSLPLSPTSPSALPPPPPPLLSLSDSPISTILGSLSKDDASYFTAFSGNSCICPCDMSKICVNQQSGSGIDTIQYYESQPPAEPSSAMTSDSMLDTEAVVSKSAAKWRPVAPPKPKPKKYRLALPQHKDIRTCTPCRFDPSPLIDEDGNVICPFGCGCCLCPWLPLQRNDRLPHEKIKVCKCRSKGSLFTGFTPGEVDRCSNVSLFDFCPCREMAEAKHLELYNLEMKAANNNEKKLDRYRGKEVLLSDIVEIKPRRK